MHRLQIRWNSIRFKLIASVLLVIVPLIGFLFYNNYYAIDVVRDQVAKSNQNLLSLYMREIDNGLNDVSQYINSLVSSDLDLQILDLPQNSDEYMMSKTRMSQKLTNNLLIYKTDAFFVYSIPDDDLMDVVDGKILFDEKETIRNYIRAGAKSSPEWSAARKLHWFTADVNDQFYLMRMMLVGDVLVGAWVKAETLMQPLSLIDFGASGGALLLSAGGEVMIGTNSDISQNMTFVQDGNEFSLSENKRQYLVVGKPSQSGDFSLIALIPSSVILQNLPYLNGLVFIISALGIILLPGFLLFLRKTLLIPLKRIEAVMKRIAEGNFNMRVEPYPASDEFIMMNKTFNHMMAQIEELKISVYEEQLNKHKAELQHLQLQINPHFFMNTLSIIYNLALTKNYENIKEMSLLLVQHFRYMFKSNLTFVPLKEEVQHVLNYIRIQELRFQQNLGCDIRMSDHLDKVLVPPLIIQTFIENAMKHAVSMDHALQLDIDIRSNPSVADHAIHITIRDNGKGFKEDVLSELRKGNRIVDEQGEHIGIWNVWHRIRLLYGSDARMEFSNASPQGAVVHLSLPLQPGLEKEREDAS